MRDQNMSLIKMGIKLTVKFVLLKETYRSYYSLKRANKPVCTDVMAATFVSLLNIEPCFLNLYNVGSECNVSITRRWPNNTVMRIRPRFEKL